VTVVITSGLVEREGVSYVLHFVISIKPDLELVGGLPLEETATPRYFYDNRNRRRGYGAVLQMTLSGEGCFERDGRLFSVPAGTAMLMTPPESTCYFFARGAVEPWRFCWVSFRGDLGFFRKLRTRAGGLVRLDLKGETAARLLAIAGAFKVGGFRDEWEAAGDLHRLVMSLAREWQEGYYAVDPFQSARLRILDRALVLPSVKELAALTGCSREHFTRQFTARFGESPGALLRREAMERGRTLLCGTLLSLNAIASRCGYSHLSTFSRAYQEHFGVSPTHDRAGRITRPRRRGRDREISGPSI
jgi:AraC-like DNA-binding protein